MPSDGNAEAALLPDGSAIVVGMFNGPAEILGTPLPDPSEQHLPSIYAARLSPAGEVQWVRAFGIPHVGLGLTSLPVITGEAVQVTTLEADFICNGGIAINDCWWGSEWRLQLLGISLSGQFAPLPVAHGSGILQALVPIANGFVVAGRYQGEGLALNGRTLRASAVDPGTGRPHWNGFVARIDLAGKARWASVVDFDAPTVDERSELGFQDLALWGGRRVEAPGLSWDSPNGYITPRGSATLATGDAVVWGIFQGQVNFGTGDENSHRGTAAFLLTIPDRD